MREREREVLFGHRENNGHWQDEFMSSLPFSRCFISFCDCFSFSFSVSMLPEMMNERKGGLTEVGMKWKLVI